MARFIVTRMLQFLPTVLLLTFGLFLISNYLPGADPIQARYGERTPDPAVRQALAEQYGLDQPVHVRYLGYLSGLAPITYSQGTLSAKPVDLGTSIRSGRPVSRILFEAYPYTLRLAAASFLIVVVLGVAAGVAAALHRGRFVDHFIKVSAVVAVSVPVFWLGIWLQLVFGVWMRQATSARFYLPVSGASGAFPDFAYLVLPSITLAAASCAYTARIMRDQLVDVMDRGYMRTALAKGCTARRAVFAHGMRNAVNPVITFLGLEAAAILAGSVLTETVFNWPGVGFTITRAVVQHDLPVVVGGVTVLLLAVMVVNLIVDVVHALLDPRVSHAADGGHR